MGGMQWIDQTFASVPPGLSKPALAEAMLATRSLGLARQDIAVQAWAKAPFAAALPPGVRAVVAPAEEELCLAQRLGFAALRVDCALAGSIGALGRAAEAVRLARRLKLATTLFVLDAASLSVREKTAVGEFCGANPDVGLAAGDWHGVLLPLRVPAFVAEVARLSAGPVSWVFSNRYDVATANARAAWQSGARELAVAVGGGDFAAWEELVLLAQREVAVELPPKLAARCRALLALLGRPVDRRKAVLGCDIFAHESGLHVDGVAKAPALYEAFAPETVGAARKIVVGKHSGMAAVQSKLRGLGLERSLASAPLVTAIRRAAVVKRRALTDEELRTLVAEVRA